MMRAILALMAAAAAAPAQAASGPFFSLNNTDFVVTLGFLLFLGVIIYFRVFRIIAQQLDKRAESIREDLAEAREMREEAQSLLASYERKQKEVQEQADRIVAQAKEQSAQQMADARKDLERSVERRIAKAREQIQAAEDQAVRDVRNRAIEVAVGASREILSRQMDRAHGDRLIDRSIETVGQKLH